MDARRRRHDTGFSLIETLVAMGLIVTVMTGLAQLLAMSVRLTRDTARDTAALAAAEGKLEWLRTRAWSFDADGNRSTDTALTLSPSGALDRTTGGYSDGVDGSGRMAEGVGSGAMVRRWAITPVDAGGLDVVAIEVCVFRTTEPEAPARSAAACLGTIRARQP